MPSNGTPYQVRRPRQRALKGVVGKRWREGLGAQRWQRVQGRPGQGPVSRRRGVAHLARGGGWLNLNASEGGQTYPFNNRFSLFILVFVQNRVKEVSNHAIRRTTLMLPALLQRTNVVSPCPTSLCLRRPES